MQETSIYIMLPNPVAGIKCHNVLGMGVFKVMPDKDLAGLYDAETAARWTVPGGVRGDKQLLEED